jgi:hypothetical protein
MTQPLSLRAGTGTPLNGSEALPEWDLLIVGNVTCDEVSPNRTRALGGTAAFAARAASCMGVRCAVVTAAPKHFDLIEPLMADPGIALHRVDCAQETAFGLQYTAAGRRLDLLSRGPQLQAHDVPRAWQQLPCTYVAPIMGECSRAMVESLGSGCIVVCAQGWLRDVAPDGEVIPALSPEMLTPPDNVTAIVLSELDHPDADMLAQRLADQGTLVAVTRSRNGVTLYTPQRIDLPAAPATEVDPTGAGDVFGLVFALNLAEGRGAVDAAQQAVAAAACVVEGPGLGNLGSWVADCGRAHSRKQASSAGRAAAARLGQSTDRWPASARPGWPA